MLRLHDRARSKIGAKSWRWPAECIGGCLEDEMTNPVAERLQEIAGLDSAAAARLVSAVVRALSEQLPAPDRSAFIARLPAGMERPRDPAGAPFDSPAPFYERVAALSGLPVARGIEVGQVVCEALVDILDAQTRAWLAARLPAELSSLLAHRDLPSRPPEAPHGQRRFATLAAGRPGSTHPLSEARVDRAHHDSIVHSQNPHHDTKLSSTSGPTQSREHETLAEADPRPTRSLSTGKQ